MSEGASGPRTLENWRLLVFVVTVFAGIGVVYLLNLVVNEEWGVRLLDRGRTFPWSVQCAMWVAFCVGLGELGLRIVSARMEIAQIRLNYLPVDPKIVLQAADLPEIYRKVHANKRAQQCFLPRLIERCILQFQASLSTAQSASLLNTSTEMFLHEVDLRYNLIRYICWVIPTLGFIGTVVGIGSALEFAGSHPSSDSGLLTEVTSRLAVSFNGTFLALVLAAVLVLLQNVIQSKEEHALNLSGQYCLDNLINRLYIAS